MVGIYRIHNTTKNKNYVGASSNLSLRIRKHYNDLNNGCNTNEQMQIDFNNGDKFTITIIKVCDDNESMISSEKYYIGYHNCIENGYNKSLASCRSSNNDMFSEITWLELTAASILIPISNKHNITDFINKQRSLTLYKETFETIGKGDKITIQKGVK